MRSKINRFFFRFPFSVLHPARVLRRGDPDGREHRERRQSHRRRLLPQRGRGVEGAGRGSVGKRISQRPPGKSRDLRARSGGKAGRFHVLRRI